MLRVASNQARNFATKNLPKWDPRVRTYPKEVTQGSSKTQGKAVKAASGNGSQGSGSKSTQQQQKN